MLSGLAVGDQTRQQGSRGSDDSVDSGDLSWHQGQAVQGQTTYLRLLWYLYSFCLVFVLSLGGVAGVKVISHFS